MIKILISCASGSGTSMLMKMTVEKACKAVGVEAKVDHSPIAEAKSAANQYDLLITTNNFLATFDSIKERVPVRGIKNPMSGDEVKQILIDLGYTK